MNGIEGEEYRQKAQGISFKSRFIVRLLVVVLIVAVILLAWYGLHKAITGENTEINVITVENRFGSVAELSTYEYSYTLVETFENNQQLFDVDIPLTKKRVIFIGEGKIKVGFNLEGVKPEIKKHKIIIELPEPEVLEDSLEPVKVIEENNIFISVDETNEQIKKEKEKKLKEAEEKGIYEEAKKKAKRVIEALYQDLEGYQVEVK